MLREWKDRSVEALDYSIGYRQTSNHLDGLKVIMCAVKTVPLVEQLDKQPNINVLCRTESAQFQQRLAELELFMLFHDEEIFEDLPNFG